MTCQLLELLSFTNEVCWKAKDMWNTVRWPKKGVTEMACAIRYTNRHQHYKRTSSTSWNEGAGNYEGNRYGKAIILELFGTEYKHWTVSLPVIKFIFMLSMLICIRINNTCTICRHIQFQFTLELEYLRATPMHRPISLDVTPQSYFERLSKTRYSVLIQ